MEASPAKGNITKILEHSRPRGEGGDNFSSSLAVHLWKWLLGNVRSSGTIANSQVFLRKRPWRKNFGQENLFLEAQNKSYYVFEPYFIMPRNFIPTLSTWISPFRLSSSPELQCSYMIDAKNKTFQLLDRPSSFMSATKPSVCGVSAQLEHIKSTPSQPGILHSRVHC